MYYPTLYKAADELANTPGIELSDQFKRIRATIDALTETADRRKDDAMADLLEAAREHDEARFAALLDRAAIARAGVVNTEAIAAANEVKTALLPDFREAFGATVESNHAVLAARFNEAAKELVTAAKTINILETDARVVLGWAPKDQATWRRLPDITSRLDHYAHLLHTLVTADGTTLAAEGLHPGETDQLLPLTINPEGQHRRRVWEAFDTPHPHGRWAQMVADGIPLEARPLDQIEPYRRPAPMIQSRTVTENNGIRGSRLTLIDPEDSDYEAPVNNGFNRVGIL